jgi:hypothetical protein
MLVASGTQFKGGTGGSMGSLCFPGSFGCTPASGGAGLKVSGPASGAAKIWSIGSVYLGGAGGMATLCSPGGSSGVPMELGSASFNEFAGAARSMVTDRLVGPGESIDFHLSGQPDDQVFLVYQIGQSPLFLPTLSGALIPKWPAPIAFAGTLPGSGELDLAIPFAGLPPGLDSVPLVVQGNFVEPTITGYLGTPLGILLRSCATTFGEPDCNANGRADDCDISAGLSLDLNENWIPDECETVLTWRVDDDAAADPGPGNPLVSDPLEDGSALHPFDAIAEAVTVAGSIDMVLLADGLYRGVGNREVDVGTKSLVIRSTGGAAACVIDPEFQGRAFLGQAGSGRFEGLTIRNGGGETGGGIWLLDSKAVIANCVIEDCFAGNRGGGLHVQGFRGRIEGCTLQGNTAQDLGGGICADSSLNWNPDFRMSDCTIVGNYSNSFFSGGGGIYADGTIRLERSLFVGNNAGNLAGGAYLATEGEVRSCLFAFNGALAGGGALVSNDLRITGSTFAQNFASQRGGGILVQYDNSEWIELESSILWGNSAPLGAQVSLNEAAFVGAIHHCDVQGGQAAIEVLPGASLTYGPGNLDVDPVFVAPLHLHPASPCIDAGDPAFSPEPGETDLEGDPRVQGSAIDMGADEAG